jgi:hypothetical protein
VEERRTEEDAWQPAAGRGLLGRSPRRVAVASTEKGPAGQLILACHI